MTEKSTPCIRFDNDRPKRIGLPEAVFCEGKPRRALHTLLQRFAQDKSTPILFTRLSQDVFYSFEEEITRAYDYDALSRTAWNARMPQRPEGRAARSRHAPPFVAGMQNYSFYSFPATVWVEKTGVGPRRRPYPARPGRPVCQRPTDLPAS